MGRCGRGRERGRYGCVYREGKGRGVDEGGKREGIGVYREGKGRGEV